MEEQDLLNANKPSELLKLALDSMWLLNEEMYCPNYAFFHTRKMKKGGKLGRDWESDRVYIDLKGAVVARVLKVDRFAYINHCGALNEEIAEYGKYEDKLLAIEDLQDGRILGALNYLGIKLKDWTEKDQQRKKLVNKLEEHWIKQLRQVREFRGWLDFSYASEEYKKLIESLREHDL